MLLLIMGFWLVGSQPTRHPQVVWWPGLTVFFAGYALLVLAVAIWSRMLARQVLGTNLPGSLHRFTRISRLARWLVPGWLLFGLFGGPAWGQVVLAVTGVKYQLSSLILGTLPAFATWMALWWAEFPADRALREQNMVGELANDLPLHMPPDFARSFRVSLRQQLLPTVLPVLLIVLLRDMVVVVVGRYISPAQYELAMLPAALGVYLASPEILRRVFGARPLEDSALRRRLESICRRTGLRYRDILLWQTDFTAANAAVIGILPGWRYVLLSDRLLETLTDREIESVFAHELGHIVHHHMTWFVVFFLILLLASLGPGQVLDEWITDRLPRRFISGRFGDIRDIVSSGVLFLSMVVLFGMLSRRFEQQADVFAARMMECDWGSAPARILGWRHHVGRRGAAIFNSALHRVAVVNNISLTAKDWFHPSIMSRFQSIDELAEDPDRTARFDRSMTRLYTALLLALLVCGAFLLGYL